MAEKTDSINKGRQKGTINKSNLKKLEIYLQSIGDNKPTTISDKAICGKS